MARPYSILPERSIGLAKLQAHARCPVACSLSCPATIDDMTPVADTSRPGIALPSIGQASQDSLDPGAGETQDGCAARCLQGPGHRHLVA